MKRSITLFLALLLCSTPLLAAEPSIVDRNTTISVSGRAEIEFEPDHVIISTAVSEEDKSAKAAQLRAMDAASRAIAIARVFGIEDEDLATDYVSLRQIVQRTQREGRQITERVTSYKATTSVRIVLRDISRYDELMVSLLDAGINRIDGVRFESEQRVEKLREARKAAVRAARDKAEYLLAELGMELGQVIKVEEYSSGPDYRAKSLERASFADAGGGGGPSISPRKLVASANVNVVFFIGLPREQAGE